MDTLTTIFLSCLALFFISWLWISQILGSSLDKAIPDQMSINILWVVVGVPTFALTNLIVAVSLMHMHHKTLLEGWTQGIFPLTLIAAFTLGLHLARVKKSYWVFIMLFNYLFSLSDEIYRAFTCIHDLPIPAFSEETEKGAAGMVVFAAVMTGIALFTLVAGKFKQEIQLSLAKVNP